MIATCVTDQYSHTAFAVRSIFSKLILEFAVFSVVFLLCLNTVMSCLSLSLSLSLRQCTQFRANNNNKKNEDLFGAFVEVTIDTVEGHI
jgi:uncharacterized membrane protein